MHDELVAFSENELNERLHEIISFLTFSKKPVDSPTAFLLGGQAGSGKTGLQRIIVEEMNNNIVVINNDTFKTLHPNFEELVMRYGMRATKLVTPFSNRMTEEIIAFLAEQRYNIVIEGTLRTVETPLKTANLLKQHDYDVNLYIMAVPAQLSYLGTLTRFEDMFANNPLTARFTSKEIHDEMVEMLPINAEKLFDLQVFKEIKVYTRDGECIYTTHDEPKKGPKAELETKMHAQLEQSDLQVYTELLFSKMILNNRYTPEAKDTVLMELESYKIV